MSVIEQLVSGLGMPNFVILIPEIVLLITAFTVFILELITKNRKVISAVSILGLLGSGLFILVVVLGILKLILSPITLKEASQNVFYSFILNNFLENFVTLYGLYVVDLFALVFKLFLIVGTIFVLIHLRPYVESKKSYYGEYYYLILFSLVGMFIMVSSPNLISFYIGLELMSIALYVLIGLYRRDYKSKEGAYKYLIIGGTGTAIVSYAIALLYGRTGTFDFKEIAKTLIISDNLDVGLIGGLVLLLIGLALKASAVPFHHWAPDAYEGATTPVTAFLAVPAKIATYAIILRIVVEAFPSVTETWGLAWALFAAASMILGNFVALRQKNVKRMLAYSSIAHTGYITAALAAPTGMGFAALAFYSIVYLFMGAGAFLLLSSLEKNEGWSNSLDDFKGLAKREPASALIMLVFMFSLLGIPPTVGFIGKLGVFLALIGYEVWWLAIVLVITSIVSAGYYIKVVANMYMYEPTVKNRLNISLTEKLSLGILAVIVLILGVYPTQIWTLTTTISSLLMAGVGR
ncbi:MAG: NADH-quinone oxidoreductase subunit N [Aquificae bacterium]|nr:NADH-quinone oxidoreductase subunit N [Aquificota bacterium]